MVEHLAGFLQVIRHVIFSMHKQLKAFDDIMITILNYCEEDVEMQNLSVNPICFACKLSLFLVL